MTTATKPLQYSKELIADIKRLYPDSSAMHKLADEGNAFLGRYLDDSRGGVGLDTILLATSLQEIQDLARLQKERNALYARWGKEYDTWKGTNT